MFGVARGSYDSGTSKQELDEGKLASLQSPFSQLKSNIKIICHSSSFSYRTYQEARQSHGEIHWVYCWALTRETGLFSSFGPFWAMGRIRNAVFLLLDKNLQTSIYFLLSNNHVTDLDSFLF